MDFLTASTTQSLTLRAPELHSELGLKGLYFDCNAILRNQLTYIIFQYAKGENSYGKTSLYSFCLINLFLTTHLPIKVQSLSMIHLGIIIEQKHENCFSNEKGTFYFFLTSMVAFGNFTKVKDKTGHHKLFSSFLVVNYHKVRNSCKCVC